MPVRLAEQLDELAYRTGARRSDVMREALTRFVAEQTAPVPRDEAEHALDVLRASSPRQQELPAAPSVRTRT